MPMTLGQAREITRRMLRCLCWEDEAAALQALLGATERPLNRPKIVCLCGSTRFTVEMAAKSWELAKQGIIALGWNIFLDASLDGPHGAESQGVRQKIDELHKRKIDLAPSWVLALLFGLQRTWEERP